MKNTKANEIIAVRSLTDSDLGIFAAHRPAISSKQRALNINAHIAYRLLSPEYFNSSKANFECQIILGSTFQSSRRDFSKVGKNWRLGGKKIEGEEFEQLDSRDFALIRSVEHNEGAYPITILFVSRAIERLKHAQVVRLVEPTMKDSMAVYLEGSAGFQELSMMFPISANMAEVNEPQLGPLSGKRRVSFPPMPRDESSKPRSHTIKDKLRSPHIFEQMLKVSSDLSAPAQISFLENIELLASQLRTVLAANNRIIRLEKNHPKVWKSVEGQPTGFVDGGLANLSMLGSAPIAARVGGYVVRPGDKSSDRERFIVLKKLINEMYSDSDGGIYNGSFPDYGALRDAARISIEAAGAVRLIDEEPALRFLFLHGALVNPVSRYTDVMHDGQPRFIFPDFSTEALTELLPRNSSMPQGRGANFISVYLRQLKALENSNASVCGVIEREATTTTAIRAVLRSLDDTDIAPHLPMPPAKWKQWFLSIVDPVGEDEGLGQRITDSLLFRCVLEPCEALVPVEIDRNELRRAPNAWKDFIAHYPKPLVSYLQPNEWSAPIRLEIFSKDLDNFEQTAELILHCSLLLPRYAFPAGLDIVDKFARIPNWMSKPINTNTAVQALKRALYKGDEKIFDRLRSMLCGSNREWLLRPSIIK